MYVINCLHNHYLCLVLFLYGTVIPIHDLFMTLYHQLHSFLEMFLISNETKIAISKSTFMNQQPDT